jgi:6-phosphogluconolactonase
LSRSGLEESSVLIRNNLSRRHFLTSSAVGAFGALASRLDAATRRDRTLTLYVGTYTSGKSEGIYVYRMNTGTGELKRFSSIKSVNPSFLAIDRSRRYLYAVNEVSEFAGLGAVSAFAIDRITGKLNFLSQTATSGADPCHLTVDHTGRSLLVANYTGGNVTVIAIRPNGRLGLVTDFKQHQGSGPKEQQKGPHPHFIVLDRFGRHAFAVDLGIDKVMIYRFDGVNRKLLPAKQPWVSLAAGAGPRHLAVHPNQKRIYVINELDSTLTTLNYDARNATLHPLDTVSTLPLDFSGVSYCADVHVHPSGRFLYGSNRGHNSIAVFAIEPRTGKLRLVEHVSTEGKWPRNFAIDPIGRFLLVANQHTDNVVVFRIDARTGRLMPTGQTAEIPTPVCLKFL